VLVHLAPFLFVVPDVLIDCLVAHTIDAFIFAEPMNLFGTPVQTKLVANEAFHGFRESAMLFLGPHSIAI